jgi:hypothetical protein
MTQLIEHLPSKCEALSSNTSTTKKKKKEKSKSVRTTHGSILL